MAVAKLIPLRSDLTFFDLNVLLDGVSYTLQFEWNSRESKWYMSIFDSTGETLILGGIKVVANWALNKERTGGPPGSLTTFDTSGTMQDPGLGELGQRVLLYYIPFAEL